MLAGYWSRACRSGMSHLLLGCTSASVGVLPPHGPNLPPLAIIAYISGFLCFGCRMPSCCCVPGCSMRFVMQAFLCCRMLSGVIPRTAPFAWQHAVTDYRQSTLDAKPLGTTECLLHLLLLLLKVVLMTAAMN